MRMKTNETTYDLDFKIRAIQQAEGRKDKASIAAEMKIPLGLLEQWLKDFSIGPDGEIRFHRPITQSDIDNLQAYYNKQLKVAQEKAEIIGYALDYSEPTKKKKLQFLTAFAHQSTIHEYCTILGLTLTDYYNWLEAMHKNDIIQNHDKPNLVRQVYHNEPGTHKEFPYKYKATRATVLFYRPYARIFVNKIDVEKYNARAAADPLEVYETKNDNSGHFKQVWISDIASVPTAKGQENLTLIIDYFTRILIGWSFSKGIDAKSTTIAALERGLSRFPPYYPVSIMTGNDDQFTCSEFSDAIEKSPYLTHHTLWNNDSP